MDELKNINSETIEKSTKLKFFVKLFALFGKVFVTLCCNSNNN